MNQAAIFDMDGLLLDTESLWGESMMRVALHHHIEVTMPQLRFTTGLRIYEVTDYWKKKFPWGTTASSEKVADDILDDIIASAKINGRVMPGVHQCLDWMQKNGLKIGLATSSPMRMLQDLVSHFGLISYFDATLSADTAKYGKPHPEVYLQCAETLQIPSFDCIALEDSVNGMVAAKAARMKVIVVPEIEKINLPQFGLADLILPSLEQLTEKKWNKL